VRTGETAVVPLFDGGFDPVALRAAVGDAIAITVVVDGTTQSFVVTVPPPARPVIVRTSPRPLKRDVPMNIVIAVVFSEPMDPATLTPATIQLRRGGVAVEGSLAFTDAAHLQARFFPAAPLDAGTEYELVVSRGIHDLDGLGLDTPVSVPFTTASARTAVVSVTVSPSEADLPLGQFLWLTAVLRDAQGNELTGRQVTWSSSDILRAEVSATGVVTGTGFEGPAVITATSDGISGTARLAITPALTGGDGMLQVSVTTTGDEIDADGYALVLERTGPQWNPTIALATNGVRRTTLRQGHYAATVTDVAANCTVTRGLTQQVDIGANTPAIIVVDASCAPLPPPLGVSPGQLAFVRDGDIFLINSDRTGLVQLTHHSADVWNDRPAWSPDGKRIAFTSTHPGGPPDYDPEATQKHIHVMNADGSGEVQRVVASVWNESPTWSPDGKRIAFESLRDGSFDIVVMSADDDGKAPQVVASRPGWDGQPAWSPDGSRIAYVSDWTDSNLAKDIFLTTPEGGTSTQSTNGFDFFPSHMLHFRPTWSPDGRRLAIVRCPQSANVCSGAATLLTMNPDGSNVTPLVETRNYTEPTWSPDGRSIAYSAASSISWISVDGSQRGVIVLVGTSPAWRPTP
jgi:Tol biopolymer transport system component